jgi:hypothetical protein
VRGDVVVVALERAARDAEDLDERVRPVVGHVAQSASTSGTANATTGITMSAA